MTTHDPTNTVLSTANEIQAWAKSATPARFEEDDIVSVQRDGLWHYFQLRDMRYHMIGMTSLSNVFDDRRHNDNQM
jgi:hypothetical protein